MKTEKLKALIIKGAVLLAFGLIVTVVSPIQPASAAWKENNIGWWYTEGTSWSTGWRLIADKWYYFDANGYMQANKWIDNYFVDNSGAWTKTCDAGKWVQQSDGLHFLINGDIPATGWKQLQDKWYYFSANGKMQTGVITDNGKEYILDAMGVWNGAPAVENKTVTQPIVMQSENIITANTVTTADSVNNSNNSSSSGTHHRSHSSSGNSNSTANNSGSDPYKPSATGVTTGAGAVVAPVKPTEKPVVKPIEEPVVKPIEKPVVKPIEEPVVKPIEEPVVKPIEKPVVKPIEKPVVKPIEKPVVKPIEKPIEEPVVKPIEEPTKPTPSTDTTSKGTTVGDGESEIYINNGESKPTGDSTVLNASAFYSKVCDRLNYLVNVHRGTNNKTTLSISSDYKISAKDKSQDMVDNNYFAHERDGKDYQTLNTELSGTKVFGENIAMNYFQNVKTEADATNIADTLFDQWKTSPGHNKNMLEDSWKSMGFGYAKGQEESGYTPVYATQHFGY